jgi:murein L,D-transpeptidase YcbB/YkuD
LSLYTTPPQLPPVAAEVSFNNNGYPSSELTESSFSQRPSSQDDRGQSISRDEVLRITREALQKVQSGSLVINTEEDNGVINVGLVELLREHGYEDASIYNVAQSIRQFQSDQGLSSDGIIGSQTAKALLQGI